MTTDPTSADPGALAMIGLRTDSPLPRLGSWQGRVIGRFQSGIGLDLDGIPVYGTGDQESLHPWALLLPEDLLHRLDPEVRLIWEGSRLVLPDAGLSRPVAATVHPPARVVPDPGSLGANLPSLRSSLRLFGRPSPVFAAWAEGTGDLARPLQDLRLALQSAVTDLLPFAGWIGHGPGLTPSWDDLLTGLLLLDRRFGRNRLVVDARFWEQADTRTTRVSAQQLRLAEQGLANLAWEAAANRFSTEPVGAGFWARGLSWGDTSGTDLLVGWAMLVEAMLATGV